MRYRVCRQNEIGVEERELLQYVRSDLMAFVEYRNKAEELEESINLILKWIVC